MGYAGVIVAKVLKEWLSNDRSSLKPMMKFLNCSVQRTQVGTKIEAIGEKVMVLPSCESLELPYQLFR